MTADTWDSSLYDRKHSFVFEYGEDLLSLLNPQPGERILDVGCGTGHLTGRIAAAGSQVVGIDNSANMIETARREYPGVEFILADATDFVFPEPFDAIFSNAALHWVTEAEAAVRCMARALRSGGRFVAELGGRGNVANIIKAAQEVLQGLRIEAKHGWYFPSVAEYATLLERHGLAVSLAILFDRPTRLEGEDGMKNWLTMFGAAMFRNVPDDRKPQVFARIEDRLRETQYIDGVWVADYRRLRIVAQKNKMVW
ncbi:MAG TPA: methyltransferase domain-containing protein [Blastocatellia bacterium]|nr:methyltransferase domain-containing protein [Blastocatellia bacterium]